MRRATNQHIRFILRSIIEEKEKMIGDRMVSLQEEALKIVIDELEKIHDSYK